MRKAQGQTHHARLFSKSPVKNMSFPIYYSKSFWLTGSLRAIEGVSKTCRLVILFWGSCVLWGIARLVWLS